MKKILLILVTLFIFTTTQSFGCDSCTKSSSFDRLKKLEGTWEGTSNEGGKEQKATVTYELTSGDSTLIETLFPGTEHAMVSIYHFDGDTVSMTHYCMLGNTPNMSLKNASDDKLFFEMKGKNGIKSKNEEHMHSVELVWKNDNELVQNWTSFKNGKPESTVSFDWKRAVAKK